MPTVVLKLFARQGTGRSYEAATVIMIPALGSMKNK